MKYRLIRQLALLLICGISALSATAKTTIKVAAAANLRYALSEIEAAYEANHKDVDLQINYGASGTFYQ
ncbi:MAG: substrate-binding domain-containing protein, partial [Rikenellaceae bacterium]